MLSVLGSLIGFAGSALPSVLGHFQEKQKGKERVELLKIQADMMKEKADIDLRMFNEMAADNEHARLIEHDIAMQSDTGFFAGLRKSVRPVITYLFFALFAAVKVSSLMVALEANQDFNQAILLVWDEETQAIFAAIISFWFGSRAIEKSQRK